ncbi:hypothetical protein LXA43DRAFT_1115864 [Ganoderma leucocontextum]|nr:hypothetical protein LXA43DRAFT_1115864 [Ganoderma leucocontextum]
MLSVALLSCLYFYGTLLCQDPTGVWLSNCYGVHENLLPAPVVTLKQNGAELEGVFVVPDLAEFIALLGSNFTDSYASAKFDWTWLAGARVLEIEGKDPYADAEHVAHTQAGNYLDHGVRVNSVFSSYCISGTDCSQRFGDLAGSVLPDLDSLTMKWRHRVYQRSGLNCVPNSQTNGIDYKNTGEMQELVALHRARKLTTATRIVKQKVSIDLPSQFEPTTPKLNGSDRVIKSCILPNCKTAVMFVSSFEPSDTNGFMTDVQLSAFPEFKAKGVSQLLVALTNNGESFASLLGSSTAPIFIRTVGLLVRIQALQHYHSCHRSVSTVALSRSSEDGYHSDITAPPQPSSGGITGVLGTASFAGNVFGSAP